jgi:hypothetical protein
MNSELEFIKRKYLWPNLWYICDICLAYLRIITKNSQNPKINTWTVYTKTAPYQGCYFPC